MHCLQKTDKKQFPYPQDLHIHLIQAITFHQNFMQRKEKQSTDHMPCPSSQAVHTYFAQQPTQATVREQMAGKKSPSHFVGILSIFFVSSNIPSL